MGLSGFLIIFSKLSDILGSKLMLLCAITIFTVFSMACGASNSMTPLCVAAPSPRDLILDSVPFLTIVVFCHSIVFRAFQGVGGSGIYSLSTIMVPLMVPPEKYPTYISIISSTFAISSVLGPVLGGAITDRTTWRWVFFFKSVSPRISSCAKKIPDWLFLPPVDLEEWSRLRCFTSRFHSASRMENPTTFFTL